MVFKLAITRRKAISSIVGGIFFLVLMTSGFTVYYVALDTQSQMLENCSPEICEMYGLRYIEK